MSKTDPFQTIQFSISTQFSPNLLVDRALSGVTTLGQGGPGSDGNEGVLCILQSSVIIGTLPSDCFESYLGYLLGGFFLSLCRDAVGLFYSHR